MPPSLRAEIKEREIIRNLRGFLFPRLFDRAASRIQPGLSASLISLGPSAGERINLNRYGQIVNSEKLYLSIPGLRAVPNNPADNQKEINHAEHIRSHVNPDKQCIY